MARWLVCGGGINGIFAAWVLRKQGHDVDVFDMQDHLGGVLLSFDWDGIKVDKGCHLLDYKDSFAAEFYNGVLGEEVFRFNAKYGSSCLGVPSTLAVPDLNGMSTHLKSRAINEMKSVQVDNAEGEASMKDAILQRFGPTLSPELNKIAEKLTGYSSELLDESVLKTLPLLRRIGLGPESEIVALKRDDSQLDDRLAAPAHLVYDDDLMPRNGYPTQQGMYGFCLAMETYLKKLGCGVQTRSKAVGISENDNEIVVRFEKGGKAGIEEVSYDYVYWSLPSVFLLPLLNIDDDNRDSHLPLGILFFAAKTDMSKAGDFTYKHNYETDTLSFRISCPGVYGKQVDAQGQTYVLAEVACNHASEIWKKPETHFDQIKNELVESGAVGDVTDITEIKVFKMPVARMLTKKGYGQVEKSRKEKVEAATNRIFLTDNYVPSKSAILVSVSEILNKNIIFPSQ